MDNPTENIMYILDKVKDNVNEANKNKWRAKAFSEFARNEIAKYNLKIEHFKSDIARTEEMIADITPQLSIMEQQYTVIKKTFLVMRETVTNQKIYEKNIIEQVNKDKEEGDKILEEFSQELNKRREELERKNPTFKCLQEKKIEIKKLQFNIRMLQHKIKERKWKIQKELEIKQQLFHKDYILLAKAWLQKNTLDEKMKKLNQLTIVEKELMLKVMNMSSEIKKKQNIKSTDGARKECILGKLSTKTTDASKNDQNSKTTLENPKLNFNEVLSNDFRVPQQQQKRNWRNETLLANNQYVPPKCTILTDVVVKRPFKEITDKTVEARNSEEKKKALQMKMDSITQKFKSKSFLQKKRSMVKSFNLKDDTKAVIEKKPKLDENATMTASAAPINTPRTDNGVLSQEFNATDKLTQENTVINMLSQESGINVQTKLKAFQFDPEVLSQNTGGGNILPNTKLATNNDVNGQTPSNVKNVISKVIGSNNNDGQQFLPNTPNVGYNKGVKNMQFADSSALPSNDNPQILNQFVNQDEEKSQGPVNLENLRFNSQNEKSIQLPFCLGPTAPNSQLIGDNQLQPISESQYTFDNFPQFMNTSQTDDEDLNNMSLDYAKTNENNNASDTNFGATGFNFVQMNETFQFQF